MFREADLAADSYRIGFIQGRNRTDAALAARVADVEAQLMKIADTGMAPAEDFGKDGCTCLALTPDGPCEVPSCPCFHHEDPSKTCAYCSAHIDEHVGLSNMSCPTDKTTVVVDSAEVVEELDAGSLACPHCKGEPCPTWDGAHCYSHCHLAEDEEEAPGTVTPTWVRPAEEEAAKPSSVKEPPHRYKCPGCTREYSLPPPSGSAYPHCPECSTDTRKVMMSKVQINRP